jgi:CO/xanthine dehydrogenase FAD-binding subunit
LAGGTDLLLELRGTAGPRKFIVDIKGCPGLKGIEQRDEVCSIGALTTIQELIESELIRERYRALWDAAKVFGCYEIRNRATIGGNVVHASPGAESGTPLFAFDAQVEIAGPAGSRTMPIGEFWLDAGRVRLAKGEILKTVLLPVFEREVKSGYERISRTKGMDLASLGVTVVVLSPHAPAEREVRVAMAAVERTPSRNHEVEKLLSHRRLDAEVMDRAKRLMAESIHPRDTSIRAKPAYKRAMVGNLTERILDELSLMEV